MSIESDWLFSQQIAFKMDHGKEVLTLLVGHICRQGEFDVFIDDSFERFKATPHLFLEGATRLRLLQLIEDHAQSSVELSDQQKIKFQSAVSLIRTLIFTANVTAPSDLWVFRQILSSYKALDLLEALGSGKYSANDFAAAYRLKQSLVESDVQFFISRGYLHLDLGKMTWSDQPQIKETLENICVLSPNWPRNFVPVMQNIFESRVLSQSEEDLLIHWLQLPTSAGSRVSWCPSRYEIELGFRIVPIVLALRTATRFGEILSLKKMFTMSVRADIRTLLMKVFEQAGYFTQGEVLTDLGERVLRRGPGPMGIIHAYYPYMENHLDELSGKSVSRWIERTGNIAASQDANARSFARALDSLQKYQKDTGFKYKVFIEHAVGQGEATRQHFDKFGEKEFQYFGADLEDKAIEQTKRQQLLGRLPENMKMISGADIGQPEIVTTAIERAGFKTSGSVMIVGNGFHEIRNQTDVKMAEVFRKYHAAGILIIFAEETALSDEELLNSAWNTYHAGFRYMHEISGQGLRRFNQRGVGVRVRSWKECAEAGGYQVLMDYISRGRSIYPTPFNDSNPAISVNYFCVP